MGAFARLAKLPPPRFQAVDLGALSRRIVGLETRLSVQVAASPELMIKADADQLEQLLINLIRNAVDAALETDGSVEVRWAPRGAYLEIRIEDGGPGLANTSNLF